MSASTDRPLPPPSPSFPRFPSSLLRASSLLPRLPSSFPRKRESMRPRDLPWRLLARHGRSAFLHLPLMRPRGLLRRFAVLLLPLALAAPVAAGGIGRPATQAEIAAADTDVRGDGAGLPPGAGTVARGEEIYEERCAACHGDFGEGQGNMPALMGGEGTLKTQRPKRTIGSFWPFAPTIFDYLRRAMPFGEPVRLSAEEAYALTAYLLAINGIVGEDFIATARSLPAVKMPNRNGFVADDRPRHPAARCMSACRQPPRIIARAPRAGKEGK